MTATLFALGLGCGTRAGDRRWLEVLYPLPRFQPHAAAYGATLPLLKGPVTEPDGDGLLRLAEALAADGDDALAGLARRIAASGRPAVVTRLDGDRPPESVPEAYLKLTLLSHRFVLPNEQDLGGLFGVLQNIAWTSAGAVAPEELDERRLSERLAGRALVVHAVDKFPRMVDYVVPSGVRIADAARIRLGAYLGPGTTVMPEGQINFNAGTRGESMVEGRVSQGVIVGEGSDLGGGASTAGTLSGGGDIVISIGRECLVGANAGTGIPLGDRCTIEAGLYVTPGTRVTVLDDRGEAVRTVRARDLAGASDLLFLRHSETGRVEARSRKTAVELNRVLHAND